MWIIKKANDFGWMFEGKGLQVSISGEDVLAKIIGRDVAKAARGAAILYAVNTIIFALFALTISLVGSPLLFFFTVNGYTWIADGIAATFTLYATLAFLRARSNQSSTLGIHFYILGLLGLSIGALLFSWGAVQFLSAGYWLRQYHKTGVARSARDGGEVAVYGRDSLVNVKSSRLVRIGWDLPKNWVNAGLVAFVIGIVLTYSRSVFQVGFGPVSTSLIGWILFIDGISFATTLFAQSMGMKGYVRLPPAAGSDGRGQPGTNSGA